MHYGRKGMKWGQNIFTKGKSTSSKKKKPTTQVSTAPKPNKPKTTSSLAPVKKEAPKKKSIKEMTNQELREANERIRLEQEYRRLNPERVSAGKKFKDSLVNDVLLPSARDSAKNILTQQMTKRGSRFVDDIFKAMAEEKKRSK